MESFKIVVDTTLVLGVLLSFICTTAVAVYIGICIERKKSRKALNDQFESITSELITRLNPRAIPSEGYATYCGTIFVRTYDGRYAGFGEINDWKRVN